MILKVSSLFNNLSSFLMFFTMFFTMMLFDVLDQFDSQYASLAASSQPLVKTIVCIPSNLQNHISNMNFNGSSMSLLVILKWPAFHSTEQAV